MELAPDAPRREIADIRELSEPWSPVHDLAHVVLGEAAMTAWRAKRAYASSVRPSAKRGFIDVQEAARLAKGEPPCRYLGRVIEPILNRKCRQS